VKRPNQQSTKLHSSETFWTVWPVRGNSDSQLNVKLKVSIVLTDNLNEEHEFIKLPKLSVFLHCWINN